MVIELKTRTWEEWLEADKIEYYSPSKMNPEVKRRWVEDLRSGKFFQAKSFLWIHEEGDFDSYCCLGRLLKLEGDDEWNPSSEGSEIMMPSKNGHLTAAAEFPNYEFLASVGLGLREAQFLAHMNDTNNSFRQIADWIEENL